MKRLSHFIALSFLFIHLNSNAQTDIQRDTRVDPVLKQVSIHHAGLKMFSRKDGKGGYVNMAVLDERTRQLKWFTCHGMVFDSARLNDDEYYQFAAGALEPFSFYRNYYYESLYYIEQAELLYRLHGKIALEDTSRNNRLIFNTPAFKSAVSTLQKLMAMEGLMKGICLRLRVFDSRPPRLLIKYHNDSSITRPALAGTMIRTSDSTEYYNTDLITSAARIVLRQQSPDRLFVYDHEGTLIDSLPLKPGKYASLLKEKEDVFLLYRGWLELQWQQVTDTKRQYTGWLHKLDSGLYNPASWQEDKQQVLEAAASLQAQQKVINNKISRLIIPEEKYVEQLVADSYKNEASEISYLPGLGFAYTISHTRGQKVYELTEHRGNVMSTVSDKKKGVDENTDGIVEYYNADIISANDYYPFGMLQPGRSYSAGNKYRYGYNGKENDNDVKGEGNQQDYGMRIYDPRIGRFLSIDPDFIKYPGQSNYSAFNSNPIFYNDPDGRSGEVTINKQAKTITVHQTLYLYGSKASRQLAVNTAKDVQNIYNAANGTVRIGKTTYKVKFEVKGEYLQSDGILGEFKTAAAIVTNTNIRNNYFRVEDQTNQGDGTSYARGLGNNGMFNYSQIAADNSTTEGHELGHGLGLEHNSKSSFSELIPGVPDLMDVRGDKVKPEYQQSYALPDGTLDITKRKVSQKNIDAIFTPSVLKELEQKGKANIGSLSNVYYGADGPKLSKDDLDGK